MAKFTIKIRGIGINYQKNDDWHVLFPIDLVDKCHVLKFKFDESDSGISLAAGKRTITISAVGEPASKTGTGKEYDHFLDLTDGNYAHHLGVQTKNDWEDSSVLMTIKNAEMALDEHTKSRYRLKIKKSNIVTKPSDEIGYSGIAVIESPKLLVTVSEPKGFSMSFDRDTTLIFDNTCQDKTGRDNLDFQMIYKVIQDAQIEDREFELEREPADKPAEKDAKDKLFDNPARGIAGLPCNQVRVSKSDLLPPFE